ncbi:hypothetical protein ACTXT7_017567 [Hymenolepis weldensis]
MSDTTLTDEMKHTLVIVSIKTKHSNLEIEGVIKVARSFVCEVRKEMLSEIKRDELAATRKRKEHCQRSAHSPTQNIGVCEKSAWHGMAWHSMVDGDRVKLVCDILPKILKCLIER